MDFPNFPHKHTLPAILNPIDIVNYRRHLRRLPDIQFPEGLLLCLERGLSKRMSRVVPVRRVGSMLGDLYQVKKLKNKVGILTDFGGGAPIVVELAEEFIALGARSLILMTRGGALQSDLKPGDIVICDRAMRDEGTSHHYLPPGKYVNASSELAESLARALQARQQTCVMGTTWTTDAPYRETHAEVKQYQSEGIKVVEMESAGLFAIGQVRNVRTAAAVVVMDSLANQRWEIPDRLEPIQKGLQVVYQAAIDTLGAA